MFDWLTRTAGRYWHDVTSSVSGFVHTVVGGIASLLSSLFGNVSRAWDDMVHGARDLEVSALAFAASCWMKFSEITDHFIPDWAYKAWWWVTHPEALAAMLLWHLVAALERNAFAAAQYLGEFALHLVLRSLRRLLHLAEAVLAAVL